MREALPGVMVEGHRLSEALTDGGREGGEGGCVVVL